MKYLPFYLLFTIAACSSPESSPPNYPAIIQGSWQFGEELEQVFYFEDSICSYSLPYGDFASYHLEGDTIFIQNRGGYDVSLVLKVIHYDSLSLVLKSLSFPKAFAADSNGIFTLQKIKQKNKKLPLFLSFCSTGCYGSCPSLSIEIDSSLKVLFYGGHYTQLKGTFSGTISPEQYQYLINYTQNLPLESIEEKYEAPNTDQQSKCLYIQYEDEAVKTCSYGYSDEPIELNILHHKLMELYKFAILESDSSLKRQNFKHQFWTCGIPLPPPPPPSSHQ